MKPVKIAFVGMYQYNCGSGNAVASYVRAGKKLGHDVRISEYSYIDDVVRKALPIADEEWTPDLYVLEFESYPFLTDFSPDRLAHFYKSLSRTKTVVVDPDCQYTKPTNVLGDTNHKSEESYLYWTKLYDSLTENVLQPFIGESTHKKVHPFLFYGIENDSFLNNKKKKQYDLLYVGNNWYRWDDMHSLITDIAPIRSRLKKVAIIGDYWDGKVMKGYEKETYSDPTFLKNHSIDLLPPAPYGEVETAMSKGMLNPILVRPILNKLRLVTPRMFETFIADTISLLPKYFEHATEIYGEEAKAFILSDDPAKDILKIVDNYDEYIKLRNQIRQNLIKNHSYEARLNQLIQYI